MANTHSDVEQFPSHHNRCQPGQYDQYPGGAVTTENTTPRRCETSLPRRKLFMNTRVEQGDTCNQKLEMVPTDTDLEVLLINSCKIDTIKVQTIIDEFMTGKEYATIFCMTETKVMGHDFQPEGVKIFSKHRSRRDKKGGGG